MSSVPIFVGLDYHQDSIQVCVLNQEGDVLLNRSAPNDPAAVGRLVQPLGIVKRVGIEACCGAADFGQRLVEQLGWNVSLGHPAYIAKIKSSPDKTDFSDGRLLADLTRRGLPAAGVAGPGGHPRAASTGQSRANAWWTAGGPSSLQVGGILREQRVKIPADRGSRWCKAWIASARDNENLSKHARWIVNDLLDDLTYTNGKIVKTEQQLARGGRGRQSRRKADEAVGRGPGDRLGVACVRRGLWPLQNLQATGAVLRLEPLQRVQRKESRRRGADRRLQQTAAPDHHTGIPPADPHHRPLG